MKARRDEIQRWQWLFGQGPGFTFEQARAFEWGNATVQLTMKRGHVTDAALIISPGEHLLGTAVASQQFEEALVGCRFGQESIAAAINRLAAKPEIEANASARADLIQWMQDSLPDLTQASTFNASAP